MRFVARARRVTRLKGINASGMKGCGPADDRLSQRPSYSDLAKSFGFVSQKIIVASFHTPAQPNAAQRDANDRNPGHRVASKEAASLQAKMDALPSQREWAMQIQIPLPLRELAQAKSCRHAPRQSNGKCKAPFPCHLPWL